MSFIEEMTDLTNNIVLIILFERCDWFNNNIKPYNNKWNFKLSKV
jgi:hypothetical protein